MDEDGSLAEVEWEVLLLLHLARLEFTAKRCGNSLMRWYHMYRLVTLNGYAQLYTMGLRILFPAFFAIFFALCLGYPSNYSLLEPKMSNYSSEFVLRRRLTPPPPFHLVPDR